MNESVAEDAGVAIVLDPRFGTRLVDLAQRMPVWIAGTPENSGVAEALWRGDEAIRASGRFHEVTTFVVNSAASPEELLVSILDTVDLHHGKYSQDPPYGCIEAFGALPTESIRQELGRLGFLVSQESATWFRAARSTGVGDDGGV